MTPLLKSLLPVLIPARLVKTTGASSHRVEFMCSACQPKHGQW